jgi:hypothetical protein
MPSRLHWPARTLPMVSVQWARVTCHIEHCPMSGVLLRCAVAPARMNQSARYQWFPSNGLALHVLVVSFDVVYFSTSMNYICSMVCF